jgi:hypothetical protein
VHWRGETDHRPLLLDLHNSREANLYKFISTTCRVQSFVQEILKNSAEIQLGIDAIQSWSAFELVIMGEKNQAESGEQT